MVGVRAEVTFYKNLFDLIGVKAEMLRVGEFKSAAEPYTRTEMSPEFRKEMEEILDDRYQAAGRYDRRIAEAAAPRRSRRPSTKARSPPDSAKELGLIDRWLTKTSSKRRWPNRAEGKTFKVVKKYGKKKTDTDFSGLAGMIEDDGNADGGRAAQTQVVEPQARRHLRHGHDYDRQEPVGFSDRRIGDGFRHDDQGHPRGEQGCHGQGDRAAGRQPRRQRPGQRPDVA